MKRINIVYLLLFMLTVFFSFDFATKLLATNFLYEDKQEFILSLYSEVEDNREDLVDILIDFSINENVDISQYTYLNDNTMHIYSTNIEVNSSVELLNGSFPYDSNYISNEISHNKEAQVGNILFPFTADYLRFYNFDEVQNVGLSNQFYISNGSQEIKQKLSKTLNEFGQVEINDIEINKAYFINYTLILLVIFSFLVFSIVQFSFIISTKKHMYLFKIWGYSPLKSHLILFKPFYKLQLSLLLVSSVTVIVVLLLTQQLAFLSYYLLFLFIVWFTLVILPTPLSIFGLTLIYRNQDDNINIKETIPFKNYNAASLILKTFATTAFLFLFTVTVMKTHEIQEAVTDDQYWDKTEDIYRITAQLPVGGSLASESKLNDKLLDLYNELNKEMEAFLIYANNFQDVSDNSDKNYLYELNHEQGRPNVLPSGRSIIIDENYLKVNPIFAVNEIPINDQINREDTTLNVLVPEKYQEIEDIIEQAYLEEFYFSSVEVDNIYNESLGVVLNDTAIEDLAINIIYVKDNQSYFTYNSQISDYENRHFINDPVSILLDGEYNSSAIAAFMTTSVFYHNDSQGEAFNKMEPFLKETNTKPFINEVRSVYQERSEEIIQMQRDLTNLMIGLMMVIISILIFLFIFTWTYFQQNSYKITIYYLFGFSYWDRHKFILGSMIFANILAAVLIFVIYSSQYFIFIYAAVLILLELIILNFLFSRLTRKQVLKTIKNDLN
ncbi:DUF1430 domain-containing protein [Shouchella sp. 1P09AA]|uniref:DUF1430 domain-containing protein n=2 Tax=Bacillales TaxID=1385 RepID=UPI0020D1CC96|nr:DUF1430 domain-containing protein [Alkalihalobacillus sp. LMS6]UTR06750.1 DUF1430 domain-containing protein [Alkalihalobacillus sp. LMS6]